MRPRRKIREVVTLEGIGLFSGKPSLITIKPGLPGAGVRFVRTDLDHPREIPALVRNISTRPEHMCMPPALKGRNSSIADAASSVATIEHVMSALAAFGLDDVLVEVRGPEVPIFDGSAAKIAERLEQAWFLESKESIDPLRIDEPVRVEDTVSGAFIIAEPCWDPLPTYTYELDYGPQSPIPRQAASWNPPIGKNCWDSTRNYVLGIAPARTFCLENEAKAMQAAGLFGHLTAGDMLVYDARGKPIDNIARFEDEPARHKLLDLIGDLALLGRPLLADVRACRSGHALTHALVSKLLERGSAPNEHQPTRNPSRTP